MEAYSALASEYDRLMDDVDYNLWAEYINGLIGRACARVFEAACGTGNIACRLQSFGHHVTAADSSDAMLRVAAQKARGAGCAVTFVRQDMRSIKVGNKADAVVCACDGPNYLDEDGLRGFAASAYAALAAGGALLFDIGTRARLAAMDGQVYFDERDETACIWQNTYDAAAHTLTMDVTLFVREGALYAKRCETHVQYAHELQRVGAMLREAGFSRVEVFAWPSRLPCAQDTQRAQFVCRK